MRFDKRILLDVDNVGNLIDEKNVILVDEEIFYVRPLSSIYRISKGGNSSVYRLTNDNGIEYAIKFSNYFRPRNNKENGKSYSRFLNEIDAIKEANEREFTNVVSMVKDGVIELDDKEYPYIIMEKADTDLKEYLFENPELDAQQKFLLCKDIFHAVRDLHSIKIYHRDIKPDNILLFVSEDKFSWKIADLGLIRYRDNDFDDIGEKIGPIGWLSPEATNKFLTEKSKINLDCTIDHNSDIFMLGELFWFVFKLNIPIGQIKTEDFLEDFPESGTYFELIKLMLSHSKSKRATLQDIELYIDYIGRALII